LSAANSPRRALSRCVRCPSCSNSAFQFISARQKKLTPEVVQQLRNKPSFMPLKIADVLWPGLVMRVQDTCTTLKVRFFQTFSR
jgi:hypothetical protein